MTALHGWGLSEQHLAVDAVVAFVDGELSPCAYDRASSHIARCAACASEAAVQRNARTAVRSAQTPSVPPSLLRTLQSIPTEAELPHQPDGLALTDDGQLVTVDAKRRGTRLGTGAVVGSSTPLGGSALGATSAERPESPTDHPSHERHTGRRTRQGASVVFSGLVLGALALINLPADEGRSPATFTPRSPQPGGSYGNETAPVAETPTPPRSDLPKPPSNTSHTAELPPPPAVTMSVAND